MLRKLLLLGVSCAAAPVWAQDATPPGDANAGDIVVTAKRLDSARDTIQASLGASEYNIGAGDIANLPGGADRGLTQVLLQAPGVTQDSNGSVHVRNEHANLQYRLNGVIVPEGVAGFGQTFDPRIAQSIDLITGPLPAQYGYRTSGIVSLKTRSGNFDTGGDIGIYSGSQGTVQPSATLQGSTGRINYFVSGSYLQNDLGIENPTAARDAIHGRTEQYRAFGYVSDILSDTSRITAFGGTAIGSFQIPNNSGQAAVYTVSGRSTVESAQLDQNQREITHYGVLSYQYAGDSLNFQFAPYVRYAQTRFSPDPAGGDILFNGYADQSRLSSLALGLQADASYKASASHTLRFGLFFQNERTRTNIVSRVLPVDANGHQTSDQPITISDTGGLNGQLYGVYLQDEWTLSPTLTLNYGARFDVVRAYVDEQQLSPRVNLVWKPGGRTTFHAGFARNFTPPPQELVGAPTLALYAGTTKAPAVATADQVKAERESYFDAGIEQKLGRGLTLALDAYYKEKRNLLDEGRFGASLVNSPFNYAEGYAWGVELRADYTHGPWSLYANVARGEEKARDVVSSQYFFNPAELTYIATNYIYTDHSQNWTLSGGASVALPNRLGKLVPSVDFLYGDGLRTADPTGTIPNGAKLPGYVVANIGVGQTFDGPGAFKGLSLRFDVTNVLDKSYLIRDGQGIGVGAPQYGARRGIFIGVRKSF